MFLHWLSHDGFHSTDEARSLFVSWQVFLLIFVTAARLNIETQSEAVGEIARRRE